jgi:alginate O-acetyltransferase complex protein AlgI
VFVVCGLWHGAGWTFLLWGVWHGAFLVLERTVLGRILAQLPGALRWAYTLAAVMGGWVLFRAADPSQAWRIYRALLGGGDRAGLGFEAHLALDRVAMIALVAGCLVATLPRWVRRPVTGPLGAAMDTGLVYGLLALALITVAAGTYSPFLYFRF